MSSSAQQAAVAALTQAERIEERLAALEDRVRPVLPQSERTDVWHEIDILRRKVALLEGLEAGAAAR